MLAYLTEKTHTHIHTLRKQTQHKKQTNKHHTHKPHTYKLNIPLSKMHPGLIYLQTTVAFRLFFILFCFYFFRLAQSFIFLGVPTMMGVGCTIEYTLTHTQSHTQISKHKQQTKKNKQKKEKPDANSISMFCKRFVTIYLCLAIIPCHFCDFPL